MKIVLNTQSHELINDFLSYGKTTSNNIVNAKAERLLFDNIIDGEVDAFVLEATTLYSQKAVDLIKKKYPYIPVVSIGYNAEMLNSADIFIPVITKGQNTSLILSCIKSIEVYKTNFMKLKNLTTQLSDVIQFDNYTYDPVRRVFANSNGTIKKFSAKEGGIFEVLVSNFGEIVKKEVILEKVWRKSDYFSSRSMDVYLSHIRKMLKSNNINLTIKNISGVGLIIE